MASDANMDRTQNNSSSSNCAHTVLVLDDDSLVRWSIGNALEKAGLKVKAAETGEEALELLNREHFDVIVTDMELPMVDGLAVTAAGRRHKEEIPVIMVTASEDVASRVRAEALGVSHFIEKPFDLEEIVSLVRELISRPSR